MPGDASFKQHIRKGFAEPLFFSIPFRHIFVAGFSRMAGHPEILVEKREHVLYRPKRQDSLGWRAGNRKGTQFGEFTYCFFMEAVVWALCGSRGSCRILRPHFHRTKYHLDAHALDDTRQQVCKWMRGQWLIRRRFR